MVCRTMNLVEDANRATVPVGVLNSHGSDIREWEGRGRTAALPLVV